MISTTYVFVGINKNSYVETRICFVEKVYGSGTPIWTTKGEATEAAKEEFIEVLKTLEGVLGWRLGFWVFGCGFYYPF